MISMAFHRFDNSYILASIMVATTLFLILPSIISGSSDSVHPLGEGHGKPFGKGRPSEHVHIVHNAMLGSEFFSKFVNNREAAVFKGLLRDSPPVRSWSDDYFLKLENIPDDNEVLVEGRKKENRSYPAVYMHFQKFVKIYNETDQYMVEPVPDFLRPDIPIPPPLQCDKLLESAIVETMMWFSSGGTKSVVHTDAVENLNCLMAGQKKFTFVPPKYKEMVLFDHPEGSYSGIDVESVDYDKYPGLAQVEFMHAEMEAGDCLYIPYKWIHQVESFNRNIAVNFWWDTSKNSKVMASECNREFDPHLTLDLVTPVGFSEIEGSPTVIKEQITDIVNNGPANLKKLLKQIGLVMIEDEEFKQTDAYHIVNTQFQKVFDLLDVNEDEVLSKDDVTNVDSDVWTQVAALFKQSFEVLDAFEQSMEEQERDNVDARDEL